MRDDVVSASSESLEEVTVITFVKNQLPRCSVTQVAGRWFQTTISKESMNYPSAEVTLLSPSKRSERYVLRANGNTSSPDAIGAVNGTVRIGLELGLCPFGARE